MQSIAKLLSPVTACGQASRTVEFQACSNSQQLLSESQLDCKLQLKARRPELRHLAAHGQLSSCRDPPRHSPEPFSSPCHRVQLVDADLLPSLSEVHAVQDHEQDEDGGCLPPPASLIQEDARYKIDELPEFSSHPRHRERAAQRSSASILRIPEQRKDIQSMRADVFKFEVFAAPAARQVRWHCRQRSFGTVRSLLSVHSKTRSPQLHCCILSGRSGKMKLASKSSSSYLQ